MKFLPEEEWVLIICSGCLALSLMMIRSVNIFIVSQFRLLPIYNWSSPEYWLITVPFLILMGSIVALINEQCILTIVTFIVSVVAIIMGKNILPVVKEIMTKLH